VAVEPEVQQEPQAEQVVPEIKKAPQAQAAPDTIAAKKIEQPQKIMAAAPVIPKDKQQLLDFVESWRQAWVSQETDPYIAFYDKTFRSGGKNLEEWKVHKAKLNKTYAFISVDISNIKVNWTPEGATVSFRQEYRSDLYSATGNKTLFLKYSDHGWKIKSEVYSRI
jgi:murein L,D-transpeptidase YafK